MVASFYKQQIIIVNNFHAYKKGRKQGYQMTLGDMMAFFLYMKKDSPWAKMRILLYTDLSSINNFIHHYIGLYLIQIYTQNLFPKLHTLSPFPHLFVVSKYISGEIEFIEKEFEPCYFL